MIKLGYKASAEQFAPGALLGFSCLAEEVGFDSVFISDHFQPWKHVDGHAPFSLTWLGALGARTSRVVIGTSVLTPTFRYHPSIVAQAFGTMGAMFPGRVVLGIGTGEGLNEVPSTGQPWPEFKERFARLREAVTLIRALWTQERVSFEGQYYKTEKATIYDRPDTPVPIYVAAAGALVARYAGRSADGFICTSGKKPELYTETLLPKVAEGIAASEDASKPYDRMIEVKVSFDTDKARALEDTRHWAALALTPEEKMSVEDPVEMQRLADALPLERAASRWIVSSDADEHVERIGYYVGLGFRHLVFHAPGPDQARFPETLRRACAAAPSQAFRLSARDQPMQRSDAVELLAVPGIPLVTKGDDLVAMIGEGVARGGIVPRGGDVFVLAQKIVSKAEGRMVDLATVKPSTEAIELAGKVQKDPRLVELILSESVRVVRARPGVLIVEHRLGLVMANAGIDQSNVGSPDDPRRALLLPVDPDGSAAILRKRLSQRFGVPIAVIISDSFGRAWRRAPAAWR